MSIIHILIPGYLAAVIIAFLTAPLGCFVVWRKMAYFGDALSHSALLGIAIGLWMQVPFTPIGMLISVIFAIFLANIEGKKFINLDTMIGIFAQSALAISIIMLSAMKWLRSDLTDYLLGDLIAVSWQEVSIALLTVIFFGILIIVNWDKLVFCTVSKDLAYCNDISHSKMRFLLLLTMAFTIGIGIKIFGTLIITALLIIPAASARYISDTPEKMAFFALIITLLSIHIGIIAAVYFDLPIAPCIVTSSTLMFFIISLKSTSSTKEIV